MKRGLAAVVLFSGCVYTLRAIPIGARAPSRATGCAVRQEQLSPAEADAKYRQVGAICVTEQRSPTSTARVQMSAGARREFDQEVCSLGGDVVVVSGLCADGQYRMNGAEYRVYRSP